MDRDVAIIVNPTAGGGRALRALPRVEDALRAQRVRFHVQRTRSLEHAAELAQAASGGRRGRRGARRRRHRRRRRGRRCASTDGSLAILPGGRGNDFARTLGIPAMRPGRAP